MLWWGRKHKVTLLGIVCVWMCWWYVGKRQDKHKNPGKFVWQTDAIPLDVCYCYVTLYIVEVQFKQIFTYAEHIVLCRFFHAFTTWYASLAFILRIQNDSIKANGSVYEYFFFVLFSLFANLYTCVYLLVEILLSFP